MFRIISFGAREIAPELLHLFRMSKNREQVYYAVGRGREIGIYNTWSECKAQIDGISNAKYRKFFNLEEAEEFIEFWKDYSSPSKISNDENSVSNSTSGASIKRRSKNGFNRFECKKLIALGVNNTPEKKDPLGLQPYVSPIPLSLKSQFGSYSKNMNSSQNCRQPKRNMMPNQKNNIGSWSQSCFTGTKPLRQNHLQVVVPKNANDVSSSTTTLVNLGSTGEARFQKTVNDSQSANVSSQSGIKKEVVCEDEEISEACSKVPKCLKILELALKGIANDSYNQSENFRNILRTFLEKISQTNCDINPQMESRENDQNIIESNNTERTEIRTEEPTPRQQQTALSPHANVPTSPGRMSLDRKSAETLALNLRLDSFEKRFDACLKEVGAIVSEMTHIKADIREIKEILGQGSSGLSPKKGKDGMLQTTLTLASPSRPDNTRVDYSSSRTYSTDQGATNRETEAEEYRSNRGKRRRLSRSNSSGNSKRFAEDQDFDVLSKIKTEEVEYTSFCLDKNDFVEVYTDGACHYNGEREAKAGIGVWFGESHPLNVSEPVIGLATNNVAEIQAARIAIELAIKAGVKKLKILTDSEFLINCVTKWMHRWKRNGWTLVKGGTVKNRKELEKLDRAASKISVRWEKVLAHSGIKGNEMADRLANQGAEKYGR